MDELKQLLQRNLEISEESFKILKKMRHGQQMGRLLHALKWFVIIVISLGAYYYVQPFVATFWNTFIKIQSDVSALSDTGKAISNGVPSGLIQNLQEFFGGQAR